MCALHLTILSGERPSQPSWHHRFVVRGWVLDDDHGGRGAASSPTLKRARRYGQHHHQTRHDQRKGQQRHQEDAASRRREFAADHIVLALEISVETKQQNQDSWEIY